jgi:ferrous iron transport protein B
VINGPERQHSELTKETVAFVGNPNCGKTTLFNAYTGANLKVANWPGVTVEGKEGAAVFSGRDLRLIDLPGTYSLTCYTMEEEVTRNYVLSGEADVIIDVVDASSLEHSLYLTLQLLELGRPVVVALNMMDIVKKRGMEIDLHRLPEMLGVPVVAVSARNREGLGPLMHAVIHHTGKPYDVPEHVHAIDDGMAEKHRLYAHVYSADLESKIDAVGEAFAAAYPDVPNPRWHAIKLLEGDVSVRKLYPLDCDLLDRTYEQDFIRERYDFISDVVEEVVFDRNDRASMTDKVDAVLCNRYAAIPIFLLIMAVVFGLTFTVGDAIKGVFEGWLEWFTAFAAEGLSAIGASDMVVSLVVDGVLSGVGTVLTFLPNIFILFLALAFLEDSGYMSRVAYVMDGIMGRLGLSGRAFIPMILGFGCTVPAIMASRALESSKDRRRVMIVTPFMSCSARLPIYVLFAGVFFGDYASLVAYSMYVLGILVALAVLAVLHMRDRAEESDMLLIELPEYKLPDARTVWIYVWTKIKDYLARAGTVIFAAAVIMWLLLSFGPNGYVADEVAESYGAYLGHFLAGVLAPIGSGDWRLALALLAGISAKEVVVSSVSVLFGVPGTAAGVASLQGIFATIGFGPVNALAFMAFCLLYVPCIATIGTIQSESKSVRFTLGTVCFQLLVAWIVAFFIYQLGSQIMLALA